MDKHPIARPGVPEGSGELRRLYFDCQPLREANWPFLSRSFRRCLEAAGEKGIALCIPEPVLLERREQWVRDARAAFGSAAASVRLYPPQLEGRGVRFGEEITDQRLRSIYEAEEKALLQTYSIAAAPFAKRPVSDLFSKAARMERPFAPKGAGFKDAVIVETILEHWSATPVRAALVTRDSDFEGLLPDGLSLIPGAKELEAALAGRQTAFDEASLSPTSPQETSADE